jgi:hypothetical protein
MLLYAQPASRIVRLTVDNIVRDGDGQVLIWLGGPPTPVTEPFAALLLQAAPAGQHANRRQPRRPLAVSRAPGGPSTQPWHARPADQPARRPHVTARTAALRQLVLQAPAPVVAQAPGFHRITAHRAVVEVGGTWSRYASGDHVKHQGL